MTEPLLRVSGLTKHFPITRGVFGKVVGQVRAVDGISFDVAPGETLGVVGESGCGKTTAGRAVLRLIEPSSGTVNFDGRDVLAANREELIALRRKMQIVFQDPFSSLNPRLRVVDIVGEALEVHGLARGADVERRVSELLSKVGLPPRWINRYPHEFSGGQRQRIGIARAIALEPKLIVCDEAVSALDVSIQAQVLNLLIALRREMGLAYLFIAHDLSVVRHVSHRVAVMYLGRIVETGPAARIFAAPAHPYTRALLSAIPLPTTEKRRRRIMLEGDVPSPSNPPPGCRFHTRCPAVMERCRTEDPPAVELEAGHSSACWHAEGLAGDEDWFRQVDERIEKRVHEVESERAPTEVAPLALPARTSSAPTVESEADVETREAWHRGAVAALLAGLVLTAFAHLFLGLLLTAGTYFGVLRRTGRQRATDLAFAAAVAGALAASILTVRETRLRAAQAEYDALAAEIAGWTKLAGATPEALGELGWRLYPLFDGGFPADPWGRPWFYRAPGADGRAFDLGSTGADGVPSTDDVGHVPKEAAKPAASTSP